MAFEALGSTVSEGVKGQGLKALLSQLSLRKILDSARTSVVAQQEVLLLWIPMFLIAGNWTYFQLHDEPSNIVTLVLAAAATGLLFIRQRSLILFLIGVTVLGFCSTKFREEMVATPLLRGPTSGVIAGGYVANYTTTQKGARMLEIAVDETDRKSVV